MRLYIMGAELKKARNALKEDRQALLKSDPSIETPADLDSMQAIEVYVFTGMLTLFT